MLDINEPPHNADHPGLGRFNDTACGEAGPIPCSPVTDLAASAVGLGVPADGCGSWPPADVAAVDGLDVHAVALVATAAQPADPAADVGSLVGVEPCDAEALGATGPLAAMAVAAALGQAFSAGTP